MPTLAWFLFGGARDDWAHLPPRFVALRDLVALWRRGLPVTRRCL